MKYLLAPFLLMTALYGIGQNCTTSALMKPGTRFTYQSYMPKTDAFGKHDKLYKMTKMVFTVSAVTDTGAFIVSHLIKEGSSFNNPKRDHYKKEIAVPCNGKRLLLPFDLFMADTTYIADLFPGLKRMRFYTAQALLSENISFVVPLGAAEGQLPTDRKTTRLKFTMRDHGFYDEVVGVTHTRTGPKQIIAGHSLHTSTHEGELTVRRVYIDAKETVTTPAGSFDCYKIFFQGTINVLKKDRPFNYVFYYDPAVGCVKLEMRNDIDGYIELESVTQP